MIYAKPKSRASLQQQAEYLARALDAGGLPPSTREVLSVKLRDIRAALYRLDQGEVDQ